MLLSGYGCDPDPAEAAKWLYQVGVVTLFLSLLTIPGIQCGMLAWSNLNYSWSSVWHACLEHLWLWLPSGDSYLARQYRQPGARSLLWGGLLPSSSNLSLWICYGLVSLRRRVCAALWMGDVCMGSRSLQADENKMLL
jgi:hypothetical protein